MTGILPGRVRVRVPATSANLGPGFDAFGLALDLHDEVVVETPDALASTGGAAEVVSGRGVVVQVAGQGAEDVPRDNTHLVVRAIDATFQELHHPRPESMRISCVNRIPHARGLGSSAAAVVAGIVAARALVPGGPQRLSDSAALRLATRLEGHPDNVAACLLGGLTIAWEEVAGRPSAVRLEPTELDLVAHVPERTVSTASARGLLPRLVEHGDAAANAGRAGLLVGALTGSLTGPDAWLTATADRLHQPYRAAAIPEATALLGRLREVGIPAVISGAGPTVLAFARSEDPEWSASGFRPVSMQVDRAGSAVWTNPEPGDAETPGPGGGFAASC